MRRSKVGIDCPLCKRKNQAIPLTEKHANQAVRIHITPSLDVQAINSFQLHYGNPKLLPEELQTDNLVTFWRCESCDVTFHMAFDNLSRQQLASQIYVNDYSATLPQISSEIPLYRAKFIRNIFGDTLNDLRIMIAESNMGGVADELKQQGVDATALALISMNKQKVPQGGVYDLICSFNMLERVHDPEEELQRLMHYTSERSLMLFSCVPFSFRNEEDHAFLAPRNGFIRMLSPKTINMLAERIKMKVKHLNHNLFILYRKIPSFAKQLLEEDFDAEKIANRNIALGEAKDNTGHTGGEGDSFQEPKFTRILFKSNRVSIREIRYGTAMYYSKDALVGQSIEHYGQYLDADRELLAQLLQNDWHAVDACANIGIHSMMMSPMLDRGHLWAIEPYTMSYRLLEGNVALNNLDNVSTQKLALGAEIITTRLSTVNPDRPGSLAAKGWQDDFSGEEIAQSTIDHLALSRCDFIHLCAPEQEPSILQGAAQTLERFHPALLVNCINKNDFLAIQAQLSTLDYRLYWHIQPFFLTDNFFNNQENVFDSAGAAKILALHAGRGQNVGLKEIQSAQDWILSL